MSRRRISRRTVLKAAGGIAFALPFLESLNASAQPATPPKRFVAMYYPNGSFTPEWFPTPGTSEEDFTLSTTHAAMEPLKSRALWLGGLNLDVAYTGTGEQHQRGLGGMLTGRRIGDGNFVGNDGSRAGWATGPSLDQELVNLIGQGTRVASLQLGVNVRERDVSGVVSYLGANSPLLPQIDPQQTFRTLFMDMGADGGVIDTLRLKRLSVLDTVREQFNILSKSVPASERAKLDEHATRVRELEQRLTALPDGGYTSCNTQPSPPPAIAYSSENGMPDAARLHLDLLAVAFACDITRVATVMFSDAKDHIAMPFIGISSDVHNVSHYGDTDPARAQLAQRDTWVMQQFARFATQLEAALEGSGSVLDNTLLYVGSELAKGNLHSHDDLPIVLAGGGAGFRMGRYVRWAGLSHNDLLTSIYQAFGGSGRWGDTMFGTGPLTGLA